MERSRRIPPQINRSSQPKDNRKTIPARPEESAPKRNRPQMFLESVSGVIIDYPLVATIHLNTMECLTEPVLCEAKLQRKLEIASLEGRGLGNEGTNENTASGRRYSYV